MRAAIYARYSSDKQRKTSIEDQQRNCRLFAAREKMVITNIFVDEELTGTISVRPGYRAMLKAADKHCFDVLLIDDLSRLARDAVEQGLTLKRLKFLDIRVVGVSEGYDSEAPGEKIHAGIKGLLNELYVDNIRFQTKRGLEGQVLRGMSAGGRAYGYRSTAVLEHGEPIGHILTIYEEEAQVIRRIHRMFADGHSPLAIAKQLNEEGIPSPRGEMWARSAIHGDPQDGTGILNNSLYNGIRTWNRARYAVNPDTGKRIRKVNDEENWVITDMPELRIVPAELWERVKARQQLIADKSALMRATQGKQARTGAGPKYLLSSLLTCGECGANFIMLDRRRYGCARHKDRGAAACTNNLKVDRTYLERTLLDSVKQRLLTPAAINCFNDKVEDEAKRQLAETLDEHQRDEQKLNHVTVEIERLINSIKAGIDPSIVREELNRLQVERDILVQKRAQSQYAAPQVADIIEMAIQRHEQVINHLETLLAERVPEARELLKQLFGGNIQLLPKGNGLLETKIAGHLAGYFSLLTSTPNLLTDSEINVVAGAGLEPATFGL